MLEPREIASAYDRWSESYDAQSNQTRDLDEIVLRRVVTDISGQTVLECGCGTGKNSVWIAEKCGRLVGMDFSEGMLRVAMTKVKLPNVLFALQDLTEPWPIATSIADVVLFNLVLEHIKDLKPVFVEASRALKPGGKMALSEYHPARVSSGKGPVVLAEDGTVSHRIPNFFHSLADYEVAAHSCGLKRVYVAEWGDAELGRERVVAAGSKTVPQLITLVFEKLQRGGQR